MKKPKIIEDLQNASKAIQDLQKYTGAMQRDMSFSKMDAFDTDWKAKLGAGIFLTLIGIGLIYTGFWLQIDNADLTVFFRVAGFISVILGIPTIVFQAIKIGRWKLDPIIKVPSHTHWRNDYPWPLDHIKGLKVNELNTYIWGLIIFLAFMIGWTAINIYGEAGLFMTIFTMLFWVVGVFFAIDVGKRAKRHLNYGTSKLYPPQMPIVQGALQPLVFENARVAAKHEMLDFYLRLIQEKIIKERDSNGGYSERVIFQVLNEKQYVAQKKNNEFIINIEIPKDSPPNKLNIDPVAYWVLDVESASDFETSFLLPVYNETRMI